MCIIENDDALSIETCCKRSYIRMKYMYMVYRLVCCGLVPYFARSLHWHWNSEATTNNMGNYNMDMAVAMVISVIPKKHA